jgi:hypothetical protein
VAIVAFLELGDGDAHVLDIPEGTAVNGLFLQRSVEALCDAIGLRLGDEGEPQNLT